MNDRRSMALLIAAAVGATACAPRAAGSASAPTGSSPAPPSVARVACEASGARVLTPVVAVQRDGVHFSIENQTATTFVFLPAHVQDGEVASGEFASHGDNSVPPGTKDMVWVFPPGSSGAACIPKGTAARPDRLVGMMARFEVVDPGRIYVPIPSDVECQGGHSHTWETYLPLDFDSPDAPIRIARERLVGLLPGDVLERAGYPEQAHVWVRIVRGGRVVAILNYGPVLSSAVASCDNSGIRPGPPPTPPSTPAVTSSPPRKEDFPPQVEPVQGGKYWVLYLAIAEEGSQELDDAIALAEHYGYKPEVRTLGCDEGAAETYRLPEDLTAVAIYFKKEADPWWVGDAINRAPWEPIQVTTDCID